MFFARKQPAPQTTKKPDPLLKKQVEAAFAHLENLLREDALRANKALAGERRCVLTAINSFRRQLARA